LQLRSSKSDLFFSHLAAVNPFWIKEDEMAQVNVELSAKPRDEASTKETARLTFIDHLRATLVILVVLHHVAVVYVGIIPFYYIDPPKSVDSLGGLLLFLFTLFNQAWFMGALFLLAGYFTPGSYERKGSGSYLKIRLVRLGIPLVIWMFVISPISFIGGFLDPVPWITEPFSWQTFWQMYPGFIGIGVTWFLALLLIFSFGYAAYREPTKNEKTVVRESSPPSYLSIGIFILGLALVSYLVRIIIPIGREILQFPTLAYLPQYLSFFIVGTIAYRRDWFRTITDRMGKVGFVTAVVATIILYPIIIMGLLGGTFPSFMGNGTWQSTIYALWDSAFAVGMVLASITFFRRYFNGTSRLGRFLSQQSYAVYVIHVPIIVFMAYALYVALSRRGIDVGGIHFGPLLKFGILSVIVVPICFAIAWLIRKIPGVSRVL
jgi:peptidoglycan/LPS O-acetylase OafA/YrhL